MKPSPRILTILITLAFSARCITLAAQAPGPAAPASASAMPAQFQVDLDAFEGTGFSIVLQGDQLVYTTYRSSKRVEKVRKIRPTAQQWQAFWAEMDGVDVWHWSAKYAPAEAVQGGTQWDVTLENGVHTIKSEGSCAYPSDADPAKSGNNNLFTKRFIRFYNAVLHLLGETSTD